MAPVFERLGKHYRKRVEFIAVNAYDRPDIAKRFGVRATPTFILLRWGKALRHFYGNIPERVLKEHIDPWAPPLPEEETDGEEGGLFSRLRRLFGRN